jgi:L-seryl-tRNA(Ser) seleniumtransferase
MIKDRLAELCDMRVVAVSSFVGGGAMPSYKMASWAVEFSPHGVSINRFEKMLREHAGSVIGRIEKGVFLLDMRTVFDRQVSDLADIIHEVLTLKAR